MLSKPDCGWSDFQLEGTSVYGLSYLNDIAFEWLDQAIHGLETMKPFTTEGFLEPGRFLCTVSYWNCHILVEDEERGPQEANEIVYEHSHTSMLQFCQYLYYDISKNLEEWVLFEPYFDCVDADERVKGITERRAELQKRLKQLNDLIMKSQEYFGENRCFF